MQYGTLITVRSLFVYSSFDKIWYDWCCFYVDVFSSTLHSREVFYFNNTLVDYYGRTQVIAQVNEVGVYQLIRHGLCG